MAGRRFRTVPDELLHVAEAAADFMNNRGFTVRPERQDLGFPYCPTLYCKREHTTCVIEVVTGIDHKKMREWVAYGKSCGQDLRVFYAVSVKMGLQAKSRDLLAQHGVGLLELEEAVCEERVAAQDLSLNVELPPLRSMSSAVKALVGLAYEHFDHGNWREGFQAAAQSLQPWARRYLQPPAS